MLRILFRTSAKVKPVATISRPSIAARFLTTKRAPVNFVSNNSSLANTSEQLWEQWRVFIRPYYYERKKPRSSLSDALRQQNNLFRRLGRRLDNANPNTIIWTMIGTNVGVFCLWQYAMSCYRTFGDGSWLAFMDKHFMTTTDSLSFHRWHTLFTSTFSHSMLSHLGINMVVLHSMGTAVIEAIGASRFLLLYGVAGITASVASVVYQKHLRPMLERRYRTRDRRVAASLGASGSLMGITTFFACAFPRATFLLFFVVPVPAIAAVVGVAGYDLYNAYTLQSGIVDSAAHVGGAAYGAAYWFFRVKPLLRAGRWRV